MIAEDAENLEILLVLAAAFKMRWETKYSCFFFRTITIMLIFSGMLEVKILKASRERKI
jgi:hypothetical protein